MIFKELKITHKIYDIQKTLNFKNANIDHFKKQIEFYKNNDYIININIIII